MGFCHGMDEAELSPGCCSGSKRIDTLNCSDRGRIVWEFFRSKALIVEQERWERNVITKNAWILTCFQYFQNFFGGISLRFLGE